MISEKIMHCLGLELSGPSTFKSKPANSVTIKCISLINDVMVKVCGVEVGVDTHVMPTNGED